MLRSLLLTFLVCTIISKTHVHCQTLSCDNNNYSDEIPLVLKVNGEPEINVYDYDAIIQYQFPNESWKNLSSYQGRIKDKELIEIRYSDLVNSNKWYEKLGVKVNFRIMYIFSMIKPFNFSKLAH